MMGDNLSLAVNYERFGHAAHVVTLADLVLGIEQNCEVIAVLGDVRRDRRAALDVLAYSQHHEVLVALEVVVQGLHRGHFLAAWLAPGRADLQTNAFAAHRFYHNCRPIDSPELAI